MSEPHYSRDLGQKILQGLDNLSPSTDRTAKLDRSTANARQEGGSHYKKMGVEPWDVVDTWPLEQQIGYYRGGALKYLMRCGSKDQSLQEIRKCQHYVDKLVEVLSQHGHDK